MLGSEATQSLDNQAEEEEAEVSPKNMSLLTRLLHTPQKDEGGSQALNQLMQVNIFFLFFPPFFPLYMQIFMTPSNYFQKGK